MTVLSREGKGTWCDPCLVPLIKALNEGGIPTVASCCGHGNNPGWVIFQDGRMIELYDSQDAHTAARFPDGLESWCQQQEADKAALATLTAAGVGSPVPVQVDQAKAEALEEAATQIPFPADPYGGFDHESLRGAYTQMTNWLRGRADMLRGGAQ